MSQQISKDGNSQLDLMTLMNEDVQKVIASLKEKRQKAGKSDIVALQSDKMRLSLDQARKTGQIQERVDPVE